MRPSQILRSPDAGPMSGGTLPGDEPVTISRAELDALRARADESRSSTESHARDLEALDRKASGLERAYKAAIRDRELATALVGKPLVPGAASQLIKLWRDDFEAVDDGGSIAVLARDGRDVEPAVAERLASPEFAHFCLPSSKGGTGARGQSRSSTPAPTPATPRTLGEAILRQWRESTPASQATTPAGWGRRR